METLEKFYLESRRRDFVYLSRAKLSMLYMQIESSARQRIAVKLNIKLPVIGVEIGQREPTLSDYDMLMVVLSHLDEEGSIGTVDEPRDYFAGQLPLRWGSWEEFVYLGGRTDKTVVGLGGSAHHLTTHLYGPGSVPEVQEASRRVSLERLLKRALSEDDVAGGDLAAEGALQWTALATTVQQGEHELIEFVAQGLAYGAEMVGSNWRVSPDFEDLQGSGAVPVVLGSPLYLASSRRIGGASSSG